jgi:hypothetical protein
MNNEIDSSEKKCEHGWHDGSCCCNCIHQLKLMKHPWNKEFGKGSIMESCGWVCTQTFEDGSNRGMGIYFDFEHGMCEMHHRKK